MSHIDKIEELAGLLAKFRRATLPVIRIHGMMTAAICGPAVVRPGKWLPFVFPETKDFRRLLANQHLEGVITLMLELYDDLLFSIRQATFVPYLGNPDDEAKKLDGAKEWCAGFFYGMTLHGTEWMEHESEELARLTAPVLYLADPDGFGSDLGKKQRAKLDAKQAGMADAIRYAVPEIYDYWNTGKRLEDKKNLLAAEVGDLPI